MMERTPPPEHLQCSRVLLGPVSIHPTLPLTDSQSLLSSQETWDSEGSQAFHLE